MAVAEGWVQPANVRMAMEWLSVVVGYGFDDSDWDSVAPLLADTDADQDRWCSYPLVGRVAVEVFLARHVDAAPVMSRVLGDLDSTDEARVQTVLDVLADSNLRDMRFDVPA